MNEALVTDFASVLEDISQSLKDAPNPENMAYAASALRSLANIAEFLGIEIPTAG